MRRLARVATVAALAAVAVWWLRDDAHAPRAAPARDASPNTAIDKGEARPPGPAGSLPSMHHPAPSSRPSPAVQSAPTAEVRRRLDEIVLQVRHAARGCLGGPTLPRASGGPDETLDRVRVRLKVAFRAGQAATESAVKVADGFGDEVLEQCVLDAVRALRWDTTHPDGSIGLEHTFYVGDLTSRDSLAPPRRGPPPPPPPPLPGIPPPSMPPPPLPPGAAPR